MIQSKAIIGIIGGSGLDNPNILINPKEKEIKTPFGEPSSKLLKGQIEGKTVIILARHGKKHNIPPSQVPYRANIWALKMEGYSYSSNNSLWVITRTNEAWRFSLYRSIHRFYKAKKIYFF